MLTITLDESDCFAAWVSAKDAGFSSSDGSDPKCTQSIFIYNIYSSHNVMTTVTVVASPFTFICEETKTMSQGSLESPGCWQSMASAVGFFMGLFTTAYIQIRLMEAR